MGWSCRVTTANIQTRGTNLDRNPQKVLLVWYDPRQRSQEYIGPWKISWDSKSVVEIIARVKLCAVNTVGVKQPTENIVGL